MLSSQIAPGNLVEPKENQTPTLQSQTKKPGKYRYSNLSRGIARHFLVARLFETDMLSSQIAPGNLVEPQENQTPTLQTQTKKPGIYRNSIVSRGIARHFLVARLFETDMLSSQITPGNLVEPQENQTPTLQTQTKKPGKYRAFLFVWR